MFRTLFLLFLTASCFAAQPAVGTVAVTTTPLNVYEHFDKESGKRFLIFVLNGKDGQQSFQVTEANKELPKSITINMAPLISVNTSDKKDLSTGLNVEMPSGSEQVERTSTYGKVPDGWTVYRTEVINGVTLNHIERRKKVK